MKEEKFPVKYCLECKQVFEMCKKTGIIYYEDFPTIALERETCCRCGE